MRKKAAMTDYKNSLDKVLSWSKSKDYTGFSKFDAFNSPVLKALSFNNPYIRMVVSPLWARSPINLRPVFLTRPDKNPKGIGLFALAYLRRYKAFNDENDLVEARKLLSWLEDNHLKGYSGYCWGYDHDWQNLHFYVPKFSPNIVVTGNIAYAFIEAYEITAEKKFLDIAVSVTDFMLKDLETPYQDDEMRNISYIPKSQWAVLNINGLAAAIFIKVWKHTKNPILKKEAGRLTAFLVDKQTDYGAWHYAWPPKTSNVKHDNYHTGNVLDWIMDYTFIAGDKKFMPNLEKGMDFYFKYLFEADGAPKWRSDRAYPYDVHGAAQSIITFTKAGLDMDKKYLDHAAKVAEWTINNLQADEGYFYYQRGRFMTKKYTLMRWCNSWMAFALSSLLLARKK